MLKVFKKMFDTTTLGSVIDTLNTTAYNGFTIVLAHLWPMVVALGIILSVWYLGRRAVASFH